MTVAVLLALNFLRIVRTIVHIRVRQVYRCISVYIHVYVYVSVVTSFITDAADLDPELLSSTVGGGGASSSSGNGHTHNNYATSTMR